MKSDRWVMDWFKSPKFLRVVVMASLMSLVFSMRSDVFADSKRDTEAGYCGPRCQKKRKALEKINAKKRNKKKAVQATSKGGSCPKYEGMIRSEVAAQWSALKKGGVREMRSCSQESYVKMFSRLSFKESGCSPTVIHAVWLCSKSKNRKNAKGFSTKQSGRYCWRHNPTQGVGLFASEDPTFKRDAKKNRAQIRSRGPKCAGLLKDSRSPSNQISCAVSIVAKHGRAYFGPLKRKEVSTSCR